MLELHKRSPVMIVICTVRKRGFEGITWLPVGSIGVTMTPDMPAKV